MVESDNSDDEISDNESECSHVSEPNVQQQVQVQEEELEDEVDWCTPELEKAMLKVARVKRFKWTTKPHVDRSQVHYLCEF